MMFMSKTLASSRSNIDTSSHSTGDSHLVHQQLTMTNPLPQSPSTRDSERVGFSHRLVDIGANDDQQCHLTEQRKQQPTSRRQRRQRLSELRTTGNRLPTGWLLMLTLAAASVNAFSLGGISTTKPKIAVASNKAPHQFRAHKGSTPLLVLDDELTTMTASSEDGDQQPSVTLGPQRLSGVPGIEVISAGGSPHVFSPYLSLKPFPSTSQKHTTHRRQSSMSMSAAKATSTMFLNPSSSAASVSLSGVMQHSSLHRQQADVDGPRDDSDRGTENSSHRGILGFDVASSLASGAETSSSALLSSRRSNVDLDSWNDPTTTNISSGDDGKALSGVEQYWTSKGPSRAYPRASSPLLWPSSRLTEAGFAPGSTSSSFFFRRPSTPSTLKNNGGAATFTVTQNPTRLPPWFPFIPSKSQIESLKVSELREACAQRGLVKSGKKDELQQRLWDWTTARQQEHQRLTEDGRLYLEGVGSASDSSNRDFTTTNGASVADATPETKTSEKSEDGSSAPNSLAEWARTVDLEPLMQKRKKIHREKRQGRSMKTEGNKNKNARNSRNKVAGKTRVGAPTKEYLSALTQSIQAPSSPYASNIEAKELYVASKQADQVGERGVAKQLLETLLQVTPNDPRVYRRLSRMAAEEGDIEEARAVLQQGIRRLPDNGLLWHGMGQLELKQGGVTTDSHQARRYFAKAIQVDPTLPQPYHALGTLEHTHGRIASAMKVLKRGVEYCPTNHRLHHALGDLYRGAKLLEDAERSYRRTLEHSPKVSQCFAYSALAYVAYDKGDTKTCRRWLRKSVGWNEGRHSQGWVSLAQLEESEGNIDEARNVCITGISQYEKGLIQKNNYFKEKFKKNRFHKNRQGQKPLGGNSGNYGHGYKKTRTHRFSPAELEAAITSNSKVDPVMLKNRLLRSVPTYRAGDRFLKLYRNWARLEERHGTFETVDEVYERAYIAFPNEYRLLIDWAGYHYGMRNVNRARTLFRNAFTVVGTRHADPYRLYAEFEMAQGNFEEARGTLFLGAQMLSKSSDGGLGGNRRGLAELFHTWAVCEWRLGNLDRAEVLFDHALRVTDAGENGSSLRSFILHSIAKLEFHRGEHHLAQHCIGLCLKENVMPGGNSRVWDLWGDVASDMGNDSLAEDCAEQAELAREIEEANGSGRVGDSSDLARHMKGLDVQHMMRQDPWYHKLFGTEPPTTSSSNFFTNSVPLPEKDEELQISERRRSWAGQSLM